MVRLQLHFSYLTRHSRLGPPPPVNSPSNAIIAVKPAAAGGEAPPSPRSPRGSRKRPAYDDSALGELLETLKTNADPTTIRQAAEKVTKSKVERYNFSELVGKTFRDIGLEEVTTVDLPPPLPDPQKEPSATLKENITSIIQCWHVSSSESTARTVIDVVLLEMLTKQLPPKKLDLWGEVQMEQKVGTLVYGVADYVIGRHSIDVTPAGRYLVVIEAKKSLQSGKAFTQHRMQAFAEMDYARQKNKDGKTVYGILSDGERWHILSLGADRVPCMSPHVSVMLDDAPEAIWGPPLKRLVNVLYIVFSKVLAEM